MIRKQDIIPDFTLPDTDGNPVSLSELTKESKLVLLFFPLAFTSTCTDELCIARDNMKFYNALKTTVAAVSVDSPYTLKEFKKSNNLNFTLLSDFNREVSESFGILYESFKGLQSVSKRASFVINQNREVLFAEVLENASELPDFKSINRALTG